MNYDNLFNIHLIEQGYKLIIGFASFVYQVAISNAYIISLVSVHSYIYINYRHFLITVM